MPSGAVGCWGSRPSVRASSRAGCEWMSLPSRVTAPPAGLRRRDRPRSRVDFPQALAPTIMVTLPSGIWTLSPSTTQRWPYLSVRSWASRYATSGILSVGRDQEPQQERGAERTGDDAHRQDGALQQQGGQVRGEVVSREDNQGAHQGRRRQAGFAGEAAR